MTLSAQPSLLTGAGPDGPAEPALPAQRRPRRARRPRSRNTLTRGAGIGLGIALIWFSLLVLIPLAAVVGTAAAGGPRQFVTVLTNPQTVSAVSLTVSIALLVTVVNIVVGTVIAWVLVRDDLPGKRLLDIVIDVPFALPTIVSGLVLLSLYGPNSPMGAHLAFSRYAVYLALAFVTLPFIVRTVQPVLEELDHDVEEAAASLGASPFTIVRRVIIPSLTPAIAAGAALSFARAISEYGSLVLLSGNLPFRTEVVSVRVLTFVENGNLASAAGAATLMLVIALLVIVVLDVVQRKVSNRG